MSLLSLLKLKNKIKTFIKENKFREKTNKYLNKIWRLLRADLGNFLHSLITDKISRVIELRTTDWRSTNFSEGNKFLIEF